MIISLTGFMGCGKSSVGRRLSQLLCCPFIDLDSVIETKSGRRIPEIFATDGEAVFRKMELEALKTVIMKSTDSTHGEGMTLCQAPTSITETSENVAVLSLGGGTVMTPECAELIHEKTVCIYLRTSADTLVSRLAVEVGRRPLLLGEDLQTRIESLMSQRSSTYEKTAHIIFNTDSHTVESAASEIISIIK